MKKMAAIELMDRLEVFVNGVGDSRIRTTIIFIGDDAAEAYKMAGRSIPVNSMFTIGSGKIQSSEELVDEIIKSVEISTVAGGNVSNQAIWLVFSYRNDAVDVITRFMHHYNKTVKVVYGLGDAPEINQERSPEVKVGQLIIGQWYHLFDRRSGGYLGTHKLKAIDGPTEKYGSDVPCYFTNARHWAHPSNDQVSERYRIFGPVEMKRVTPHIEGGEVNGVQYTHN